MIMAKLDEWIILETDDFIVLNKPAGLLSIPDREGKDISLKKMLKNMAPYLQFTGWIKKPVA